MSSMLTHPNQLKYIRIFSLGSGLHVVGRIRKGTAAAEGAFISRSPCGCLHWGWEEKNFWQAGHLCVLPGRWWQKDRRS
jgi:hypothetical protein